MKLLVNYLLSTPITEVAMTIHIRDSAILVPSLDRFAPKYSKLTPYSKVLPFNLMPAMVLSWKEPLYYFFKEKVKK
ncbi:hypothetical protein DPMN_154664 [Dreissena polymorpha]|uniref:Uncharacterized protein n=1 Tax=Dreissena polymorpha TaxID=45954 RepID=A0A9D4J769_DREPO|nr:hypothetical protein DPMN_154664 [Dreissena polymorpha]